MQPPAVDKFVALIYLSYIKKAMDDDGLFKDYTMQEMLDELDIIEYFQEPGVNGKIKVHHPRGVKVHQ